MDTLKMTSNKPYLIRAIYEWIIDNGLTPYIVVDATVEGVQVPAQYVEDGSIILNISPRACRGLHLGNDRIVFSARFGGLAVQIFAPPFAVKAVYAKENGKGMVFADEEEGDGAPPPSFDPTTTGGSQGSAKSRKSAKGNLRVIK